MHRKRKDFSRAADLAAHRPNGYHGYGEIGGTKDESRILTFSNAWPPKPSKTSHLTSLRRMQTSVTVLNERIELMHSLVAIRAMSDGSHHLSLDHERRL